MAILFTSAVTINKQNRKVVIVQQSLRQYRKRFYELLKEDLKKSGIQLLLIYGEPDAVEVTKGDAVDFDWGFKINNHFFKLGSRNMCWQPCLKQLQGADLVIVEQASKLLINYLLFCLNLISRLKLAFWGHGKNMQSHRASHFGEAVKRFMSRRVHWWFAYNEMSAEIVRGLGYPADRITSVQNAIDIQQLSSMRSQVTHEQSKRVKQGLGLKGNNVGIYIGGMYTDKRLEFLLASCSIIRSLVPDFEIIFVGAGPEYSLIERAAQKYDWIHAVGPKFNDDKVLLFSISKILLLPGLVGLAVLDSFALEVPLVTTDIPFHSPEIAYVQNGYNGLILEADADSNVYADAVVELLTNESARQHLVKGCKQSKYFYSIESMVERFSKGIKQALRR